MDGELLFSEVNDDFPSTADTCSDGTPYSLPGTQNDESFAELSTLIPSALPADELALLTSALTKSLLDIGFRDGVFRLEARVVDSAMHFAMTPTGIDLVLRQDRLDSSPEPSVFLIEINPRAPGHRETIPIEYTYGIDYWALHLLSALPSNSSAPATLILEEAQSNAFRTITRSLSHPLPPDMQYPTHLIYLLLEQGGTFRGAKPLLDELMEYVVEGRVHIPEGKICEAPGKGSLQWPFVVYFIVAHGTGLRSGIHAPPHSSQTWPTRDRLFALGARRTRLPLHLRRPSVPPHLTYRDCRETQACCAGIGFPGVVPLDG